MIAVLTFENVTRPWIWALAILVGAYVLYRVYRDLFRLAPRRLAWTLLALRVAGLTALLLALAKPAWTSRSEQTEPGRVAIVIDNSRSMALPGTGGRPRYDRAREAASRIQAALDDPKGGPRMVTELFDVRGLPMNGPPPASPDVERTDLARAVAQTASRLRSQLLTAVVLISDGMDNSGSDDVAALQDSRVPVFTLGFAPTDEASGFDLAVRRVQAPERVIVNNAVKADVLVAKAGGPAAEARLTVRRGTLELAAQPVSFPAGRAEKMVTVNFTPRETGSFVFTAQIAAPGEQTPANNARPFPVQIDPDPLRLFYVEGFLRHEYKFLKNRFEDDPDISLVSIVRRANPERQPGGAAGEMIAAERLAKFDVVILGDMEGDYLAEAEYRALAKWVDEGHALLVLGGYHSFGPSGFRSTPLADILPVVFADREPYQSEEPFTLELTESGQQHAIFDLTGDRVKDAGLWATTPPMPGASRVARAKHGAEVLAVDPKVTVDGAPMPVVTVQRYGGGRVMTLGLDTTWQWSRLPRVGGQSDTLFARFWSQTARWLAGRNLAEDRSLLAVATDQPDVEVSKPILVRVTRQPRAGQDLAGVEVMAEAMSDSGKIVPVAMKSSSREPDVFTGTLYPSTVGRYTVTATLMRGGKPLANQATDFLVTGPDLELARTGTSRETLQAIATATGGAMADVSEAAAVASKIERSERRIVQMRRLEFWNSPGMFLFFLAAVAAEWVLRRRNRLV